MRTVLAVNAGSSSLKLALFDTQRETTTRRLSVRVDRIGGPHARLLARGRDGQLEIDEPHAVPDHEAAFQLATARVAALGSVDAVGHRIVRGGVRQNRATMITSELLDELRASAAIDPDHLPQALALIVRTTSTHPAIPQVACFDTAFHRTMPRVAQMYGLPRAMFSEGVVRLGFHGLSCEHVVERLAALDSAGARGRVVVAHLGGGASLTAICDGESIDTTMGFSPASGLVMGTRSGDLDPSVILHLMEQRHLDARALRTLVNRESGLLGVSGLTADMRELLDRESTMPGAAEAVALFCYTARKYLGAMTAVLGGLDTLVFTGGIGEHAAPIRERMCAGFDMLGLELDPARNDRHDAVISTDRSRVIVRVMPADEELMIAKHVRSVLQEGRTHHASI